MPAAEARKIVHEFNQSPTNPSQCSRCGRPAVSNSHYHHFHATRMARLCVCGYGRDNERHGEKAGEPPEQVAARMAAELDATVLAENRREQHILLMGAYDYVSRRTFTNTSRNEVLALFEEYATRVKRGLPTTER